VIKPGTVSNEIYSHQDMLPTLVAAAGDPDIAAKLKQGYKAGNKTFKVYIDGFNLIPHWKGEVKENPRPGFLYWSDDGDLMAIRYGNWKVHFAIQRAEGLGAWQEPFVELRFPMLVNLRTDPFENADVSATLFYDKWRADRVFMLAPAGALVGQYMQTMMEFPPRQSPDSFTVGDVMAKLRQHQAALETGSGAGVK
jgi:arylsulfatase A-like enzyme